MLKNKSKWFCENKNVFLIIFPPFVAVGLQGKNNYKSSFLKQVLYSSNAGSIFSQPFVNVYIDLYSHFCNALKVTVTDTQSSV